MSLTWSKDCPGKQFLIEQFDIFHTTNGKKGIDPAISKLRPKLINEKVYNKHPENLGGYKKQRFPYNFMDTVRSYNIDRAKQNGRRKLGEFLVYLFHFITFNLPL